ncbi:MerR family transcriptional regulator [Pseudonocardia nematodicida]|uniref:MerR family transcriptional regulator n=1 Tax=Pseudonocardia nematodicida TaxID=1206997 RepID=A0ABV1KHB5_9PSEU
MAWSTREIAELAGTSLRAVRHYHEVGLLEEPERRSNGYKQYGVAHLVRVLRIKRLTDLGFSLSQIAAMGDDDDHPEEALRALDAELAATIERLQRARVELGLILRESVPTDLPSELAPAADAEMSETDRSLVVVMSRVVGPERLKAYADMLQNMPSDPTDQELDELPADADEATRQDLAERMAPFVRRINDEHPGLQDTGTESPRRSRFAATTMARAMQDLYNPAQLDVLQRVGKMMAEQEEPAED